MVSWSIGERGAKCCRQKGRPAMSRRRVQSAVNTAVHLETPFSAAEQLMAALPSQHLHCHHSTCIASISH